MIQTDKRFHVTVLNNNKVRFEDYETGTKLLEIPFKEYDDAVDCKNALQWQCDLMNSLAEENEQLKEQIGELKYSKKILRTTNKNLELGIRNLRKSFEKFDNMRVEHIRFLQKRMKKYGISIYYNDDDGDVE